MRRKLIFILASLCLTLTAVFGGLRLAGSGDYHTAIGQVSVSFKPALQGRIEFYAPITDWGVRANAFNGPTRIRVEPRSLDRQAIIKLSGKPGPLLDQLEKDLRCAIWKSALWSLLWIILAGLIVAMPALWIARKLKLSRRWAFLPLGLATSISLLVGMIGWASFDQNSVRHPTYWAKGNELPQLMSFIGDSQKAAKSYKGSVANGLKQLAEILAGKPAGLKSNEHAWLISDLHSNTLVLNNVRNLVDHNPVFFVGDFAHSGGPGEQDLILPALQGIGHPLIAVSGNHDSHQLMRRLAAQGTVVLTEHGRMNANGVTDGEPIYRVAGFRVLGVADPLEAQTGNEKNQQLSMDEPAKILVAQRWIALAKKYKPQIMLIHQSGIADLVAQGTKDQNLAILTGHDHRQHISRYNKTIVIDAGSVGAGGVLGAGRQYVGLARLYLRPPQIEAADLLRLEPISGSGQAERVLLDQPCRQTTTVRCDYSTQDSADLP